MPLSHTREFRVRFYECDAYGHLNNTNYVRFMQETAMDASAAAGYDSARYRELGRTWWVAGTEIEYLRPARYDDRVQVKTWVADFRRASSRRMYEFRLAGSDDLLARGFSDWVFLDSENDRPASVPPEMVAAFIPEGTPERYPERERFPDAPPPPPGVFTIRLPVRWGDLDSVGHVNNAVYLEYVEECGLQAIAQHHWPWDRMRAAGFAILLRKHQVRYLQPAVPGDVLDIRTWVSDVRRSTATRHYTIERSGDGMLLARIHTLGVWVDLSTGRPIRIPPDLILDFAPNIV